MPYLVSLNVTQNQIENIDIFDDSEKLKYLQICIFTQNQIKEIPEIKLKSLISLTLSTNQISSTLKFSGHPKLKVLDLEKNKLTSFAGIRNMPLLEELIASENEIATLEGLADLPSLKILNIRKNPVLFKHNIQ